MSKTGEKGEVTAMGETGKNINSVAFADNPLVIADKLCCKSGHRYLLRDISWQVKAGERWLVFGLNGSGKTTLLSIIAGVKQYTEGDLWLFGEPINDENIIKDRRKIGFVSASFFGRIYENESALEIVLSAVSGTFGIDGNVPLEKIKKALDILQEFNLAERADYPFYMFSKGEQQNILIARALINNPALLILDEPCTGLDIYNREYLFETIAELGKRADLAIIYVTHYVEEILPLFQNALLLKNGRVFKMGQTAEIFNSAVFSEYLDYPARLLYDEEDGYRIKLKCKSKLTDRLR